VGRPLTYEQIAAGITDMMSDMGPDVGSNPELSMARLKDRREWEL
jgi:hypothetical protein